MKNPTKEDIAFAEHMAMEEFIRRLNSVGHDKQDSFAKEQALQAQLDLERKQHFARWLEHKETVDVLLMKIRKLEQRLMDIEDPTIRLRRFPW